MAKSIRITAQQLRAILSYDPDTGEFRWKERDVNPSFNAQFAGKVAGHKSSNGYIRIEIFGRAYFAHRIAWLYMTGEWPDDDLDHKNIDGADNRFRNLRPANDSQNCANRRVSSRNKCGIKGVQYRGNSKWRARIRVNYKLIHLGQFLNQEDAAKAYEEAAVKYFGEFARTV